MTLRVAFIDDRDIVRSGVQLLSLEADIQVVGEFSSAGARRPRRGWRRKSAFATFRCPTAAGWICWRTFLRHPRGDAVDARQPGAGGNGAGSRRQRLPPRCKPEDLITAVRTAAGGGVYLMPEIAQQLARVRSIR